MNHYYLGIDPGVTGGIAVIRPGNTDYVAVWKMPATERDVWQLLGSIRDVGGPLRVSSRFTAVIEWIHPAIQGIGKASMSKLYGNYKMLRAFLTAASIPFEVVMARKWQQAIGISPRKKTENRTKWKNRLKARCQQLFPETEVTLAVADALLIANYCRWQRTRTEEKS